MSASALHPGLCGRCRHASVQRSAKGSEFWRCRLADRDERYPRYPALPVSACPGFEQAEPAFDPARGARLA